MWEWSVGLISHKEHKGLKEVFDFFCVLRVISAYSAFLLASRSFPIPSSPFPLPRSLFPVPSSLFPT